MEKGTPHTRLHVVKELVKAGKVLSTQSADTGALALGFNAPTLPEICDVILALTPKDFFKSMTAYGDHTIWHEVYRPTYNGQQIYLKFIVNADVLIVSFKEL